MNINEFKLNETWHFPKKKKERRTNGENFLCVFLILCEVKRGKHEDTKSDKEHYRECLIKFKKTRDRINSNNAGRYTSIQLTKKFGMEKIQCCHISYF